MRNRNGYSLLELVLSIALVGGTLAPALALMRDGLELSRTIDERLLLSNYAIQKLEERIAIVAAHWDAPPPNPNPAVGQITDAGGPNIHFIVTWSDDAADGGIQDELMHIEVTTYVDENNNDSLDANEPSCEFRTKIARLATYEAIANL